MPEREFAKYVYGISGEKMEELFELADVHAMETAKLLLHYCIMEANERGQPRGQDLNEDGSAGTSGAGIDDPSDSVSTSPSRETDATEPKKRKIDDVERRLLVLEKGATMDTDVDKVKDRVKSLAAQQEPIEALILITLDELPRIARKAGHKDMKLFEELFRQCGRLQGKVNMADLCLTVLEGQGADLVSKAVNKCIKESLGLETKNDSSKSKGGGDQSARFVSPLAGLYPAFPQGAFGPMYPPPFLPMSQFPNGYGRSQGYRPFRKRNRLACHFCDSNVHLIKDCEKMKALKRK